MHRKMKTLAAVLLSFVVLPTIAKTRAAPPASQPAETQEQLQDKVLPAVNLDSVSLTDFFDYIHSSIPGFQYVIARDPGVAADYPTLPPMKLQKVTLGQVLDIIQDIYPLMEFRPISSDRGAVLYVFKFHNFSSDGPGQAPQSVLKVYRLTEAVDALASRIVDHFTGTNPQVVQKLTFMTSEGAPEKSPATTRDSDPALQAARKKAREECDAVVKQAPINAMNDVLSLIKAALAQAGDSAGVSPVVQLHQETQTLIVRGTADQISAVQKALEVLTPPATLAPLKEQFAETQRRMESELTKATDEAARRTAELQEVRAEADSLRKALLELEVAQERLKVQMEALKKKPAAKE